MYNYPFSILRTLYFFLMQAKIQSDLKTASECMKNKFNVLKHLDRMKISYKKDSYKFKSSKNRLRTTHLRLEVAKY